MIDFGHTPASILVRYKQPGSAAKFPVRFWSKVDRSGSCWLWTACTDRDGYGWINFTWGMGYAHRIAYEIANGPIPAGMVLDHSCRTPSCVDPAHLEPVSDRVNILRGIAPPAVNASKTHCKHGHRFDIVRSNGRRGCRTCDGNRQRRYRARKAAATN